MASLELREAQVPVSSEAETSLDGGGSCVEENPKPETTDAGDMFLVFCVF
jgi:hypothetical protein